MSIIGNSVAKDRVVEVEYPSIENFFVSIRYVTRDELTKIRNRSLSYKFNKRTHQREEEVDSDKFLEYYSDKVIAGWNGLKIKHLPLLVPTDLGDQDVEKDIPYSKDEALALLRNSTEFDAFISDCMSNLETFEIKEAEEKVKN